MRRHPIKGLHRAVEMGELLLKAGFIPFLPQLCEAWHLVQPREITETYEHFLPYDFHWITRCDAILRLEGESMGADEEVKVARALGKPVFFNFTDLYNAYRR